MGYLRIKEWDKFQHYKDRNPPWIKLHNELLHSRTWVALDDASKALAVAVMLLASRTDNNIPADPGYIKRVAYLDTMPDLEKLVSVGFIEIIDLEENASELKANASARLAKRTTETETETETEKKEPYGSSGEQGSPAAYSVPLTKGKFHHITADDLEHYRKTYPAVDVDQSFRNILEWLGLNKRKRSGTVKGSKKRITTWLANDQDKASKNKTQYPTAPDRAERQREADYFLRGAV